MRAALFALTMFLSAALSFVVQPLIGKRLLPLLGGTPAVWNTCLVFFQASLLAGYLFAHRSAVLPPTRQARLHFFVLVLPVVTFLLGAGLLGEPLPVVSALLPTQQENPMLPLVVVLLLAVGVPFAVLSATAPLLQRWFGGGAGTYVLYAASNAGSLLGLLGYPLFVEPFLSLPAQQGVWAVAAVVCLALIAVCGLLARDDGPVESAEAPDGLVGEPSSGGEMWVWLALAALPAALLNSVSVVVTTEVAPVPLLWVVPLSLYLLSFIIVFASWSEEAQTRVYRLSVPLVLFVLLALVTRSSDPLIVVAPLHLLGLFALCLVCHGELVLRKPPTSRLTAFYLSLAVGGVLGGAAVAFVAPLVFSRAGYLEYPLALMLVALVRPRDMARYDPGGLHWSDVAAAVGVGLLTLGLIALATPLLGPLPSEGSPNFAMARGVRMAVLYAVPLAVAFALVWRRWRFSLALLALFLASGFDVDSFGPLLHVERNFFGSLRVTRDRDGKFVRLIHGATQHGQQAAVVERESAGFLAESVARATLCQVGPLPGGATPLPGGVVWGLAHTADRKPLPLLYYYPTGPIGRLLETLPAERRLRVGAVGLGCGSLAYYARRGERWTFFEIDPAVVRIARDLGYFTYLKTSDGEIDIVLGDARRSLEQHEERYNVLILDAFSSDAIPVHLLTREALQLYLSRLTEDGVIAYHVSNRYLDLPPLLGRLGREQGLIVRVDEDFAGEAAALGKSSSTWVVLARSEAHLSGLKPARWPLAPDKPGPIWTDQFSNLLGVWTWGDE